MKISRTAGVPPMKRLIDRAEFEQRLATYSAQILKSFKRYEEHWESRLTAQREKIDALEARLAKLEPPPAHIPDITTERVEP